MGGNMSGIRLLNPIEYLINFSDKHQKLADYYIKNDTEGRRYALGFSENQKLLGFSMIENQGKEAEILYLFIMEEVRGKKYGKALLEETIQWCWNHKFSSLKVRLSENKKEILLLKHLFEQEEFYHEDTVQLFRCYREDYHFWEEYMQKHGNRMIDWLLKEGYRAVSFAEVSPNTIEIIRNVGHNDFDTVLNPNPVMNQEKGKFESSISSIVLLGEEPVAYCLVNRPDSLSLIFEQMSVKKNFMGSGVVFLALARSIQFISKVPYEKVSFAMYHHNKKAIALSGRFFKKLIRVKNVQQVYKKKKSEDEEYKNQ